MRKVGKMHKENLFPNGVNIPPASIAWMGISNALANIQQYMQTKQSECNNDVLKDITKKDVIELVNYIHLTLNNVLTNTFPNNMTVDLEKEINDYCGAYENRPVPDFIEAVAKHFFELGLKTRKEE